MKKILRPTRLFHLLVLISILFSNVTAISQGLKPNPDKERQEREYLQRQQQEAQKKTTQLSDSIPYTISKSEQLILIKFNKNTRTTSTTFFQDFRTILQMRDGDVFRQVNTLKDEFGYTHATYQQYFKGVLVVGGQFTLQEKGGKLLKASGKFFQNLPTDLTATISKEQVIKQGKRSTGAKKFKWENPEAQQALRQSTNDPEASYYPSPELVLAPVNGNFKNGEFKLSYKLQIQAEEPYQDFEIYVDAKTGKVINQVLKTTHSDVTSPNNASTYYSGQQTITTDAFNSNYRLRENATRPIQTLNMLNYASYGRAIDFTNVLNNWRSTTSIITNFTVTKLQKKDWDDLEEGRNGAPDIYIEIKDLNGNLIFGVDDAYFPNTAIPVSINIPNIPLLVGGYYTVTIFDNDIIFDDLLGTYSFVAANGTVSINDKGTKATMTAVQGRSGALDAHWGLEKTYDYFKNIHGRSSYDGNNGLITAYLHPNASVIGSGGNNAFWSSTDRRIVFGDGNGTTRRSYAALDICGHEMTHGVIDFNGRGGLLYQNESGALNESFADIFGTSIEFFASGSAGNWTIGENTFVAAGRYSRSMENPKDPTSLVVQPDTYQGTNWFVGAGDNGGVHINSGVQNKWFYLLSEGGQGKIDGTGPDYNVPGITRFNAAQVAYRNMIYKLSSTANFEEAYLMSLESVLDMGFTEMSDQYRNVREAWYAVGVAKKPEIISFDPTKGSIGTAVTITGKNFTGLSQVGFNGTMVDAADFVVDANGTEITLQVPAGATTGKISIIAGYQTVESADDFTIECTSPLNVTVSSSDATSFSVDVANGNAPYTYSIDNVTFQNSNVFSGLTPGNTYTVYVKDASDCKGQQTFYLSPAIQCNVQSGSGGQGTAFITQILGQTAGSVSVSYQMYGIPDQMDIYYNNVLVASTGGLVSGGGTLQFNYTPLVGGPYHCIVRMYAPNNGTAWDFIAYCPVPSNAPSLNRITTASTLGKRLTTNNINGLNAVLSPNPVTSTANLYLSGNKGQVQILVNDLTGRQLWSTNFYRDGIVALPVKEMIAGTYFVTVVTADGSKKVLKLIRYN